MRSSRRPGVAPSGELVAAPPPSGRRRKRQQIRSRGDFRQQAVSQVAVTFGLSRARAAGPGARWCRGHTDDRGSKFQDATRADSAVPQRGAETCQLKHSSRNRGLPGRVVLTPLCSSGPCAHHAPVLIMPQCSSCPSAHHAPVLIMPRCSSCPGAHHAPVLEAASPGCCTTRRRARGVDCTGRVSSTTQGQQWEGDGLDPTVAKPGVPDPVPDHASALARCANWQTTPLERTGHRVSIPVEYGSQFQLEIGPFGGVFHWPQPVQARSRAE